jgi:2-polyprenyl-3-methyl-5-hydroxy-6-metoxy-1,4-benzoquinol methylase
VHKESISIPALLCGHAQEAMIQVGNTVARCPVCGSFWDLSSLRVGFTYDGSYPVTRGHTSETIGQLKIKSFQRWLSLLGLDLSGSRVCEVGFGGGWSLSYMRERARAVFGIEAIPENIASAVRMGLDPSCLFEVTQLPDLPPESIDLWIYQDSFEHIPDPRSHLEWVVRNSSDNAAVLLVLPEATSFSERLLGQWWPHRIADHFFHWAKQGLENVWGEYGFRTVAQFRPVKCITLGMIAVHAAHMVQIKASQSLASRGPVIWFNLGEQGLLLRRGG